jgi:hypothetical protein
MLEPKIGLPGFFSPELSSAPILEQTSAVWRQDERDRREIDRAAALLGRSTRQSRLVC